MKQLIKYREPLRHLPEGLILYDTYFFTPVRKKRDSPLLPRLPPLSEQTRNIHPVHFCTAV